MMCSIILAVYVNSIVLAVYSSILNLKIFNQTIFRLLKTECLVLKSRPFI